MLSGAGVDAPLLPQWVLGALERWDIDGVADEVATAAIEATFGDRGRDDVFFDRLHASILENTSVLRAYLRREVALRDIELVDPVRFAGAQAELAISQSELQRSYRAGFLAIWQNWCAHLKAAVATEQIDSLEYLDVVESTTKSIFIYQDYAINQVVRGYIEREETLRRSGEQMRQQIIRELIDDRSTMASEELLRALGYDINSHHVAVQVGGLPLTDLKRFVTTRLRGRLKTSGALFLSDEPEHLIVWISRPVEWEAQRLDELATILRELDRPASISRAERSLAGFRLCLDQVHVVERVRTSWKAGPQVLRYDDVELEALLLADIAAARRFVETELGALSANTRSAARIRETLEVSFALDSHVETARRLELHEHTVRNRLRRAEELLGRPLTERRVETQVALRMHTYTLGAGDES